MVSDYGIVSAYQV